MYGSFVCVCATTQRYLQSCYEVNNKDNKKNKIDFEVTLLVSRLKLLPEGNEEQHMIPSRRSWERVLFEKRGNMSDEELKVVYDEFI